MKPATIVIIVRMTVSVDEDQAAMIEQLAGDDGEYESKSAVVRGCIRRYERTEELEQTIERLEREKRLILEQREENTELKEYVESEMSREERQRMVEQAPIHHRVKWWFTGKP